MVYVGLREGIGTQTNLHSHVDAAKELNRDFGWETWAPKNEEIYQ